MTKRSQVFLLLAALALVFCAGAGVYISSTAESYAFSSETVYGSRESAVGISVERESVPARARPRGAGTWQAATPSRCLRVPAYSSALKMWTAPGQ